MKSLLIDIDGVICQYDFPKLTEKYFGVRIPNGKIFTYSLEDTLGVPSREVSEMFAVEVFAPPNLVPGAVQSLRQFISKGYDVFIHSSRLAWMTPTQMGDWLDEYDIPFHDIITEGYMPTYVYAHVDDSPKKLLNTADETTVKHSVLFVQPWNLGCMDIHKRFERARNWTEIRRIINGD